jgi:N-acetylglucosaminyl-diphospho-decaprenol L-rhamnosyltransferase
MDKGHQIIADSYGVVIINWNSGTVIADGVRSFIEAGVRERHIVIVDNGSTDNSIPSLEMSFPTVKIIENPVNSYSRAVNLGAASLPLPFIIIANPDVIVSPDCIAIIAPLFESRARCGAVGCHLTDGDGNDVTRFSHTSVFRAVGLLIVPSKWRGVVRRSEQRRRKRSQPFPVKYIEGSFVAVRKAAFASIAGFHEEYTFFHEDSDFSLRLLKAGWEILHHPDAHALHLCGTSFAAVPEFRQQQFYRNTLRFFREHYPGRYPVLFLGIMTILRAQFILLRLYGFFRASHRRRAREIRDLIRFIKK